MSRVHNDEDIQLVLMPAEQAGGSSSSSGSGAAKSEGTTKLVLDDRLKQALITDHGFSDLQLEQLTGSLKN